MLNKNNMNNDIANSFTKYNDFRSKGLNIILDSANKINKWYDDQLNKISEGEIGESRLETNIESITQELENRKEQNYNKIETKIDKYDEVQTNNMNKVNIIKNRKKIKTQTEEINIDTNIYRNSEKLRRNQKKYINKQSKISERISTAIRGVKLINNTTNSIVKMGNSINTGLKDGEIKSFENISNKIMTKPSNKIKNTINKSLSKTSKRVIKKTGIKTIKKTSNVIIKLTKILSNLIMNVTKLIISMLPSITPVILIIIILACFCNFFGIGMNEEARLKYEKYMIDTQNEYDKTTVEFYNQGKIVDGTIEGKGIIDWKAPLSIIQFLNGDLKFDSAEEELLNVFKDAELFEKITESNYSYEKEIEETDENGNKITKKEMIIETKNIVSNPSLEEYIIWCNNNFSVINNYKEKKGLVCDINQTRFTDNEIEQIKLLYNSNSFFELFSDDFKSTYSYVYININDEDLKAIYNEFLKNTGKRYFMDHSNLNYDECMEYYDCSSWVIHCLAHTGIKIIPNTNAKGVYNEHCYPISVNDRKAGDLIFLKDTYDTGNPGGISHIGIYMGELTINGETAEWVIDTGGNPSGVRIRKYTNGWWNGPNFYGFGRLK